MKTHSSSYRALVVAGLVLMSVPAAVRPGSAAGPIQAPRGQDTERPRGQDTERPRGQDTVCPRGEDTERPRGGDAKAQQDLAE